MENSNDSGAPTLDSAIESVESGQTDQNVADGANPQAAAPAPELTKAQIKKLKSLKIKVDGEEFDEQLPFEIDDSPEAIAYMQKHLQMSRVAGKRMQEHSSLQADVNKFLDLLRQDPISALSDPDFGVDIKKLATEVIEREIANSKKSPEQIEKEKIEAELKALKAEREREKQENQAKEMERLQKQEFERMDMQMEKALEKSELPKSPYIIKKMADYMLMGLQNGVDVSPEDVLPLVREEVLDDIKQMFAVMPEEVVERVIGKDVLGKLRKKNLAKAKAAPVPVKSAVKDVAQGSPKEAPAVQKKTLKELFNV